MHTLTRRPTPADEAKATAATDGAMPCGAGFDFALPPELEATMPAEARGLTRDGVRLMVSRTTDDRIEHAAFRDIGRYLDEGDVLVINTSGTIPAALDATLPDGTPIELHLSTRLA